MSMSPVRVHRVFGGTVWQNTGDTDAMTACDTRLRTMRRWCEEELVKQQLDQEANLFRFTTLTYHQEPYASIPCRQALTRTKCF